jgi:hypothetical protein
MNTGNNIVGTIKESRIHIKPIDIRFPLHLPNNISTKIDIQEQEQEQEHDSFFIENDSFDSIDEIDYIMDNHIESLCNTLWNNTNLEDNDNDYDIYITDYHDDISMNENPMLNKNRNK